MPEKKSKRFITLEEYIIQAQNRSPGATGELSQLRRDIGLASKITFGEQSYRSDGSLNREYLAEQAFGKSRVEELNAIVHPKIPAKSMEIKRVR